VWAAVSLPTSSSAEGRLFDWIEAGKQVNAEASGAVGFAPRWLAQEIEPRRIDQDRACPFASN
jgi:uncharacterized protein